MRLLATVADAQVRDLAQAVELPRTAVELVPNEAAYWNTLGIAQYRAENYKDARSALEKPVELSNGGGASDTFFMAMAEWRLRHGAVGIARCVGHA